MSLLNLDIITPEGKLFEGECLQIDIPGKEGRLGILARHMDFVTNVKPGIVHIYFKNKEILRMAVSSGLAEVKSGKCTLLIEKGIDLKAVNIEQAKEKFEFSKHQLHKANTETMRTYYADEVEFYEQIMLAVFSTH